MVVKGLICRFKGRTTPKRQTEEDELKKGHKRERGKYSLKFKMNVCGGPHWSIGRGLLCRLAPALDSIRNSSHDLNPNFKLIS